MKSFGMLAALAAVIMLLGAISSSQPAFAAVHCIRVYGVMGGFNGDTSIQYVELRMSSAFQTFTNGSSITFYNASGGSPTTFTLTSNVANGQSGASILIGTAAFDAAWAAGSPDFIMPQNVISPSGQVAFGVGGFNCGGTQTPYDAVAYGTGWTGTEYYPPEFGSDLPTSGNQAIQIKAGSFDTIQGTPNGSGNNSDYEVFNNPMPCKNAPSGAPVCGPVSIDTDLDDDGVINANDLCPNTAAMATVDSNGCSDAQVDGDGDGICNPGAPSAGPSGCTGSDNCPNTANPGQANADGDALGDACDTEGPSPNTNGTGGADDCTDTVDNDGDTLIDLADGGCSTTDTDGDGVPNVQDNCPTIPNPAQENFDGDSQGDACDADDDDDGYPDDVEAGSPVCGNNVNDDGNPIDAGDSAMNDGCPAVGAAEGNCSNTLDDDGDGRINDGCPQVGIYSEGAYNIGTNTLANCDEGSVTNPSPSWPSDMVSGGIPNSTDKVTITDLTSFTSLPRKLNTSPGHVNFNQRWDLVPGRGLFADWIVINDLTAMINGTTGNPPMFGVRAFNGPLCTGP